MGDVLSLVEQAHQKFDQDEMAKQEERLRKGEFTLDDFKKVIGQTKKLGPINKIMSMLPGMSNMAEMMADQDTDQQVSRLVGIIDSMTPDERRNPSRVVDMSRRRRIAKGAGVEPHEVNELVKQFDVMADLMKSMASMGPFEKMKAMQQLGSSGALNPGGRLAKQKGSTGKRLTNEEKAKLRKQREKEMKRKKREEKKKKK
jgi:signal recognition particle subunit SRP54